MRVTLNPAVSIARSNQINHKKNQTNTISNSPQQMRTNYSQVAFKGWWEDMTYYFAKRFDDKREREKETQFAQVRKLINDDVRFMAERQGIPLEEAKRRYEDNMDLVSIPLKYNGDEEGLNKVIGYSVEKYRALTEMVMPLMFAKNADADFPAPNGMLLYGPGYTGKTHFARALGEHIELKSAGQFTEVKLLMEDILNDNGRVLADIFDDAEERFQKTGIRQVLFFDNLDSIFDEELQLIPGVFIAKTRDCAKKGVTWLGTSNFANTLPGTLFKPFRLTSDIFMDYMSEGEKSAVMSYFWAQRNRKDDSNHNIILSENRTNGFHFYPPEVNDVSKMVDEDLDRNHDRDSYWNSDVRVRRPVNTNIVNENINKYLSKSGLNEQEMKLGARMMASNSVDYVRGMRTKYADKK